MNYKGKELKEANGKDYPLGMTPKKMLVWTNDGCEPYEKEVLGFYGEYWIADSKTLGVSTWKHAAEIPTEPQKKWRPFDGITECHEAIDRHGSWVINTNNHQHCQIVAYDKTHVLIAQTTKTYRELLDNFIFVNGFPCGEEEE